MTRCASERSNRASRTRRRRAGRSRRLLGACATFEKPQQSATESKRRPVPPRRWAVSPAPQRPACPRSQPCMFLELVLLCAIPLCLISLVLVDPSAWIMDPLAGFAKLLGRGVMTAGALAGLLAVVAGGIMLGDRFIHRQRAQQGGTSEGHGKGIGGLVFVIGLALMAPTLAKLVFFGSRDERSSRRHDPLDAPATAATYDPATLGFLALIGSAAAILFLRRNHEQAQRPPQ